MLLTVAPNPSIDRTLYIPRLATGAVHRATAVRTTVGGKGLNVARAARILGGEVLATGPLAGHTGRLLADLAAAEGMNADWYWLKSGEIRICLLINHETGDATVINEPGEPPSGVDWAGFAAHVERLAGRARAVVLAGSLPPGINPAALSELARAVAAGKREIYLDTSGAALATALAQPTGLVIKINRAELTAGLNLSGQDFSIEKVVQAGQTLLARGAAQVVVTLGGEGALAITPGECWQANAPPVDVISTVGSGDSMLAGLAVARLEGRSIEAALAFGVACGAANAATHLPGQFERGMVEALLKLVEVNRLR